MFKRNSLFVLIFGALLLAGCQTNSLISTEEEGVMEKGDAMMEKGELPEVIKIGFVGPLTGPAASYGQDVKSGVELYFSENPTIDGKEVEVIYEDGKCNGQDAANAVQKLINVDKIKVLMGGICSGEALAMAPIVEQNEVIFLSSGASSPDLSTAGDFVFRNYPSDDQVAKTMVEDVLAHHEVVAMITEQTDYAQGYRNALNKHFDAMGEADTVVMDEAFAVDNTDFRTLLTKVKNLEADALIAIPQTPVGAGFIAKQAKELGLEIQMYGGDAVPGPDFFDTAKDAAEGFKVVMASEDPSRSGYDTVTSKVTPQSSIIFPLFGYDAAQLMAETIAEVGYDGPAIRDAFYSMPVFKGVASDINFDENGDNNVNASVKIAKDGEFVLVTE